MNLETLLGSLGAKHLHCYPNRGNAGDGMIQAGLFQLCERLGITLEMIEYPAEQTGQHVPAHWRRLFLSRLLAHGGPRPVLRLAL